MFGVSSFAGAPFAALGTAVAGRLKYWNGSAWVLKTLKIWNGSAWVDKTLKASNGVTWI
jgi:hypothetical protein